VQNLMNAIMYSYALKSPCVGGPYLLLTYNFVSLLCWCIYKIPFGIFVNSYMPVGGYG